jgi:hypothetical protein
MQATLNLSDDQIERLARKRAGMRMGWIIHAAVFVAVNALLAFIALGSGRTWAIYPFLGWGLGLAIHGAVVLAALPGSGLMERLVNEERRRLAARRDPW